MCGRYVACTGAEYEEMTRIVQDAESRLSGSGPLKTGEIFPTDLAPVITLDGAVPMTWGFPRRGGGVVINARAETAADRPMFRGALFTRRLAVPGTGFFEWKHTDGKKRKDKYLLRLPGSPILYMAGLYTTYRQPDGGKAARFVILTTAANESVAPLHDRMPVVLATGEIGAWLSGGQGGYRLLARPGPSLLAEKVS